jgi:hypothetical protein
MALWKKLQVPVVQQFIYNERDEIALSIGRWEVFKSTRCLDFMIGLDSSAEQLLFQACTPRNSIGILTGNQLRKREEAMEVACQECLDNNLRIAEYLERHVYKVVPHHDA